MARDADSPELDFIPGVETAGQPVLFLFMIPLFTWGGYLALTQMIIVPYEMRYLMIGLTLIYWFFMGKKLSSSRTGLRTQNDHLLSCRGLFEKNFERSQLEISYQRYISGTTIDPTMGTIGTIVSISQPGVGTIAVGAEELLVNDALYEDNEARCQFLLTAAELKQLIVWLESAKPGTGRTSSQETSFEQVMALKELMNEPDRFVLKYRQRFGHTVKLWFVRLNWVFVVLAYLVTSPDLSTLGYRAILLSILSIPFMWWVNRRWSSPESHRPLILRFEGDMLHVENNETRQTYAQCHIKDVKSSYCVYSMDSNQWHVLKLDIPFFRTLSIQTSFLFDYGEELEQVDELGTYSLAPAYTSFLLKRLQPILQNQGVPEHIELESTDS